MAADLAGVFEDGLRNEVLKSRVLVVGAGGIGCEILKNLVLSGFSDIEVIDLDTIDVSNLNRQFLFHKEHVGKSKAEVARESALSFNPKVNIKAHHDSITTTKYGATFFKEFSIVLNALDNRQARNHVNRMCLNADIPLIESGTAGYDGQVELIKKGLTLCYECTPKAAQKTFPGCTIRNTPSEPIHCIVWAKHLFNQLFGESNEDEDVSPDTADPEAAGEAGENAINSETDSGNVERVNTRKWAQNTNYDPEKIFNKLFHDDIKYLLTMSNLWKTRTPPNPIKWGSFKETENSDSQNASVLPDQKIWSIAECAKIFATSLTSIKEEFEKLEKGDHLVWDKDDKHSMDFVAACANIRATIFNIGNKSRFDVKSMAGNIIPAIATTNAITAGLVVMHAFKVLQGQYDKCQSVYVRLRPNARNQLFVPDKSLNPPNPKCYVCSAKPEVVLKVDTEKMTVKELRDDVLIKALNMINPDVTIDGQGVIVISSEEGETEANNDKKLSEIQIVDGAVLHVDDFFQDYELKVTIYHKVAGRDEDLFEVVADPESLKPKALAESENGEAKENDEAGKMDEDQEASTSNGESSSKKPRLDVSDDDDDMCIVEDNQQPEAKESAAVKRRANGGEGPSQAKRMRTEDSDDDLIVLDD